MNKKCYGLLVAVDGKQEYLYESPYDYIERIGCKPIDDYFKVEYYDELLPINNPTFINSLKTNFNIMFYSRDGEKSEEKENTLMTQFCNIYAFNSPVQPLSYIDYIEGLVCDDAIILPKNDKFIYEEDKEYLQHLLNNMDGYLPKDREKYMLENMNDEELENMGVDAVKYHELIGDKE